MVVPGKVRSMILASLASGVLVFVLRNQLHFRRRLDKQLPCHDGKHEILAALNRAATEKTAGRGCREGQNGCISTILPADAHPSAKSPSSERSRCSTLDLATRTAPADIDNSAATAGAGKPSTIDRQKACQERTAKSPRINSSARKKSCRSGSSSGGESSGTNGAGKAARRRCTSVPPAAIGWRPVRRK